MDEFTVRMAPRSNQRKISIFKLHRDDDVTWTEAKMKRENDSQPWQIKLGSGRNARRFKAKMEGGVGDNASYFVFYKSNDKNSTYEICPVDEWYNVSATQRYKTLTAEEAEQKFEQRLKMLNLFSVMHSKRAGENGEEGGSAMDNKSFKVSEFDDWAEQPGDDEDDSSGEEEDEEAKKARRKKSSKKVKDDPDDAPNEAKEDSDEGDFEQREVDYMSDSSSDSSLSEEDRDEGDVKGIAEEEALRELLSTDDEDEVDGSQQRGSKSGDKALGSLDVKLEQDKNASDDSSDSEDDDVDDDKLDAVYNKKVSPAQLSMVKQKIKQESDLGNAANINSGSAGVSGLSATGTSVGSISGVNKGGQLQGAGTKRKAPDVVVPATQSTKRPCTTDNLSGPANGQEKIVEDLIVKYLSRKPMTLKSLLKDIKSKLKRHEMDDDLVNTIASIIKRLQPDKQKINQITYLSLKS